MKTRLYYFSNKKECSDWPYPQTTVKQSGYCNSYSPLFNTY